MPDPVYDPENEDGQRRRPSNPDQPDNQEAGGSPDPRDELRRAETGSGDTGTNSGSSVNFGSSGSTGSSSGGGSFNFNPGGDKTKKEPVGSATLSAAESGTGGGTSTASNSFFTPTPSKRSRFKGYLRGNRKKAIIGGSTATAGIVVITAGFLTLIPLKMEHIVENLQNRTFASSQQAVENETQNMLQNYIVTKVLPAYKDCGTTVSKNCTPRDFGDSPVGNLYRAWANNKLENKLATNYGIEFKYNTANKTWYLKAPGVDKDGFNIGPNGEGLDNQFHRSDRAGMRAAIRNAMQNETQWKKVMYRYKVGRLLESKYGVVRCVFYCGKQDELRGNADNKIVGARLKIAQRVLNPRTSSLGIVTQCLLDPNCSPESTEPTAVGDQDGAPIEGENAETDTAVRTTLEELAQSYPGSNLDELKATYDKISEKGYQSYALDKVLEKVGLSAISSQVTDAIPVIGWVTSAASVITFVNHSGPAVQKLGYITNSSADVDTYMMFRTFADEIHTGHVDALEVGSMSGALDAGYHGSVGSNEQQVGGTASAEQTQLYQNWIDGNSSTQTASLLDGVLPGHAYAASKSRGVPATYICQNGQQPPSGQDICPEAVLGQSNQTLDSAHQFLNAPVVGQITTVAQGISGVTGAIGGVFGDIINAIPGVSSVTEFVTEKLLPYFELVVNKLIPNAFGAPMSGGSTFVAMGGGADVAGNAYAQTGLGGQELTDAQTASIVNEQQSEAQQSFAQQPMFARMFNTDSQYSLVSKIAMSIPIGKQAAVQSSMASILNPLGAFSHGFGSMLSGKANAAVSAQPDPFGITQFGYPEGSIPRDPETYWDNHCSDKSAQSYQNDAEFKNAPGGKGWAGNTINSSATGMPVNKTTNPCMLIKATVGAAGAWFDTSLLTPYDLANQESGTAAGDTATTSTAGATIDMSKLDESSIDVACAANTKDLGVQDGYAEGKKIKIRVCSVPILPSSGSESNNGYGVSGGNGDAVVNSRVSGAVYAMAAAAKQNGVNLKASSTFRTMAHQIALQGGGAVAAPPGYSNHQMGVAIDFDVPQCDTTINGQCSDPGNSMWDWLDKNAGNFGYKSAVPSEAWHWSPTGN